LCRDPQPRGGIRLAAFTTGRDAQALHEAVAFNAPALLVGSAEEEGDLLDTRWSLWQRSMAGIRAGS